MSPRRKSGECPISQNISASLIPENVSGVFLVLDENRTRTTGARAVADWQVLRV